VAESAGSRGSEQGALTPTALFSLDYIPPPPALKGFVTTFYLFRCDERDIRDVQPAAVGHLIVFLRGKGEMQFASGRTDASHPVSLLTPCSAAAPIVVEGPFHCVGAALSPLGWAALSGLHAGESADRMIAASEVFGLDADAVGAQLTEAYEDGIGAEVLVGILGDFLAPRLMPVNPRHAALMQAVAEWLGSGFDPPLDDLLAKSAYSPRQTQRLVERYFGLPPRELKRKYRALRVAGALGQRDTSDAEVAMLTNLFYDQSHMIREIRHFVGRTPGRLAEEAETILSALIDMKNYREIEPQVAAMPRYGANDSQ
jgi:AraC-like DNA-binding protein